MAGGGTGKETNYWPGFVDALANVVVTMIFVIVVFTIALLYFSQNKVKEALAAAQKVAVQTPPVPNPTPAPVVAELQKKIADLQKENDTLKRQIQVTAGGAASPQGGAVARSEIKVAESAPLPTPAPAQARIQGSQSALQIVFPTGAIELDAAALGRLEAAFAGIAEQARTSGVELVGIAEVGPYSEGRRLSYYRNLALRNWLIEKGIPAGRIRMRIADVDTGKSEGVVQLSTAKGG
jgi:outer membrane protein OmpA-like peptidoglycan-associated protein